MKKIEKLTEKQHLTLKDILTRRLAIARSVQPIDKDEATKAISAMYRAIGKKEPTVLFFSSPMMCVLAQAVLVNKTGSQMSDQLFGQLSSQLRDQLRDQLSDQLSSQLRDQLRDQLFDHLSDQLRDQLRDQLSGQLFGQLSSQLRDQLSDQLFGTWKNERWKGDTSANPIDRARLPVRDSFETIASALAPLRNIASAGGITWSRGLLKQSSCRCLHDAGCRCG